MPLPKSRGSPFQALDLSGFPHGRSEAKTNDLFLLAPPESCHQQNASLNSRIAQRRRVVERFAISTVATLCDYSGHAQIAQVTGVLHLNFQLLASCFQQL